MENETLRELQKKEALKRMKALALSKNVIEDFKNNDTVYYSERQNNVFDGILYWVDNDKRYTEEIKKFEAEHDHLVYHAQLTHTQFGDLLSLLFVSTAPDDWEGDLDEIKNDKQTFAYVINMDDPYASEFGTIGIKAKNGGVSRTF